MWSKFFDFFKSKKRKFHEQTKKEKNRLYLRKKEKKSIYGKERLLKQRQLHINFSFKRKSLIGFSLIGLTAAIIGIIFLFKAQYFSVQNITIESPDELTNINIAYDSIDSFRSTNIFNIQSSEILKKLQTYQPNVTSISLEKQLPDSLDIITHSSPIILNAIYSEKVYAITQNWVAIKKNINPDEQTVNTIEVVQDRESTPINIDYTVVIENEVIEKINQYINSFKHNLITSPIEKNQFYPKESELHILLQDNTLLIFDINWDVVEQIKKLIVFYKENEQSKHIYIDLRIENKVFYCGYENEFQCKQNLKKLYTKK